MFLFSEFQLPVKFFKLKKNHKWQVLIVRENKWARENIIGCAKSGACLFSQVESSERKNVLHSFLRIPSSPILAGSGNKSSSDGLQWSCNA